MLKTAALFVVGAMASGAAHAQQIVSRTSDYTATWANSAFADAGALYAGSYSYDSTFKNYTFSLYLYSDAANLTYNYGGGVTINPWTAPSAPYTSPEKIVVADSGTPGAWGWTYNIAAGAGLPLSYGRLGEFATLNFDDGGYDDTKYTFGYSTSVYLPGDWTTEGFGTGDYNSVSVAAGFSPPTFTYDPITNTTTVFTSDLRFTGTGGGPDLRFRLVGAVAPEPPIWAMMLLGFAGLGLAHRARARLEQLDLGEI